MAFVYHEDENNPVLGCPNFDDAVIAPVVPSDFSTVYPVGNLLLHGVSARTETSNVSGIKSLTLDAGARRKFSLIGIFRTNATAKGGWRMRIADTQGDLTINPFADTSQLGPLLWLEDTAGNYLTATNAGWTQSSFTMEVWFSPGHAGVQRILHREGGGSPSLVVNNSGFVQFKSTSGAAFTLTSTTKMVAGQWYHVAGTYDSATSTARLIINGVQEATLTSVTWVSTGTTVEVGRDLSGSEGMTGRIHEPRFWSVARTAASILADMNKLLVGTETNLLGAWALSEGQGITAANSKAGAPAMTLNGSPMPIFGFDLSLWSSPDLEPLSWKHALFHSPIGMAARWIRFDFLDPSNTTGVLRIARLIVSEALQFPFGPIQGSDYFGYTDDSFVERSPLGFEASVVQDPRPNARIRMAMNEDWVASWLEDIYLRSGTTRDVVYVRQPTGVLRVQKGIIHGRLENELHLVHENWQYYTCSITVRGL